MIYAQCIIGSVNTCISAHTMHVKINPFFMYEMKAI